MTRYGRKNGCGCDCGGPNAYQPRSREEFVEDLEDYKTTLEAEITGLEKRIRTLREKRE